jgi:prefoldin subunit 5
MSEPENLVLAHLRELRAEISALKRRIEQLEAAQPNH